MEPTNLTRLSDAAEIIEAAAVCLCKEGQTAEDVLDRIFLLQLRTAIVDELKTRDEHAANARQEGFIAGAEWMREQAAQEADKGDEYEWSGATIADNIRALPGEKG